MGMPGSLTRARERFDVEEKCGQDYVLETAY